MKDEFSRQTFEKYSYTKFHEIRPVGAELFRAEGQKDRQTDRRTKVAFRNFANTP